MNNISNAHPRAIALLLAAVALPITPAFAQEAGAPPPVAETVPPPVAVPAPSPAPAAQAPVFAPQKEVVQPVPPRPAAPVVAEDTAAPASVARSTPVRRAARSAATSAPVAAAVSPAPIAAVPVTEPASTAPETVAPAQVPTIVPDPAATDAATITETTTTTSSTPWIWIGLGIVALAAVAWALLRGRKRSDEEVYSDEPVVAATSVVAPVLTQAPTEPTPVIMAPVSRSVANTASVSDDERPWIGLSVWPREATGGTLQFDLIVENVGEVEAHDVRVTSLIIDGTKSTPMESTLINDGETRSIDIGAGHSIPIAQTIEVVAGASPHILAEARYPLPGGGEGHIAARFALDTAKDGTVEARLDDLLERV
ncbi:MAG: hypothetical protein ABI898_05400 [Sphingomonadales bacterium]